jgi:predicted nucleic acid-binding protein
LSPAYFDKTERTADEFYRLLGVLKRRITIIPLEELTDYIKSAERISPDLGDMAYFALALKFNCPIWSHKNSTKVPIPCLKAGA